MVTPEEQALIADRMAEAGISNMGAYMRKMALNGYVLHVDLSDIRELVALQRRCANNLNQVAVHANTYGIYPSEIAALQKDYADLWEPLSELLKKAVGGGEPMICRGAALCRSPAFTTSGQNLSRGRESSTSLCAYFPSGIIWVEGQTNPIFLMEVAAMIVLKILAAPVMVALSLLAAMVTFLFCVASAVCELGCIVLTLLSLILFIGGQTVGGIVFLVLAFLVSPFGVPAIAEWLVDKLHSAKFALRDFITG